LLTIANSPPRDIFIGYNDLTNTSNCKAVTSQLSILNPRVPTDDTELVPSLSMPDITDALDSLLDDITLSTPIDFTTLTADLAELDKTMNIEHMDLQTVQKTLQKTKDMDVLGNFNPFLVNLEKLDEPSNYVKIIFWTAIVIALAMILCCINAICPSVLPACVKCTCGQCCSIMSICCRANKTTKSEQQPSPSTSKHEPRNQQPLSYRDLLLRTANQTETSFTNQLSTEVNQPSMTRRSLNVPPNLVIPPIEPMSYREDIHPTSILSPPTSPQIADSEWTLLHVPGKYVAIHRTYRNKEVYFIPSTLETVTSRLEKVKLPKPPMSMIDDYWKCYALLSPMKGTEIDKNITFFWDAKRNVYYRNVNNETYIRPGYKYKP
jgi:hypothetical protein